MSQRQLSCHNTHKFPYRDLYQASLNINKQEHTINIYAYTTYAPIKPTIATQATIATQTQVVGPTPTLIYQLTSYNGQSRVC